MTASLREYLNQHWLGLAVAISGIAFSVVYWIAEYLKYGGAPIEHFWLNLPQNAIILLTIPLFAVIGYLLDQKVMLEREARKSGERFRELFENAYDIIFSLDLKGNIISANQAAIKISGYAAEEIVRLNISRLLNPEVLQDAMLRIARIAGGEMQAPFEYEFIKKDGSMAIIELSSRPIISEGKTIGIHCIARDITERKLAEKAVREANEKLNSMIKTAPYAVIGIDTLNRVEIWNPAAEKLFGWSKLEVLGRVLPTVPASQQQFFQKSIENLLSGRSLLDIESAAQKKDGSIFDIRLSAAPVYDTGGELTGLILFISDITGQKHMEQKIVESERYLKNIIESSADSIIALDARGNLVLFNDGAEKLFGYRRDEVLGRNIVDGNRALFYGELEKARRVMQAMRNSKDGRITNLEVHGETKDGRDICTGVSASLLKNEKGEVIGTLGIAKDITRQKLSDEALKASEEKYRSLVESTDDSIYLVDSDCKFLLANNTYISRLSKFNLIEGQPAGRYYSEFYSPEETREFAEKVKAVFETASSISYEHRSERDGRSFIRTLSPVAIESRVKAVTVISKDITERKLAEEALSETNEKLQALIRSSPLAIVTLDLGGNVEMWNLAAERIFGWKEEEVLGAFNPVFPEDRKEAYLRELGRILQGESLTNLEVRGRRRNDSPIDLSISSAPLYNAAGKVTSIMAVIADITERKQIEGALKQSEERYRSLFDDSPVSLWEQDFSTVIAYINSLHDKGVRDFRAYFNAHPEAVRECAKMIKIVNVNKATLDLYQAKSKTELLGSLSKVFADESFNVLKEELISIIEGKKVFESESVSRTLSGKKIVISLRRSVVPGYEENQSKVIISIADISERKRVENALRESEANYRDLSDSITDIFFAMDKDLKYTYWNKASEMLSGVRAKDAIGKSTFDIFPDIRGTKVEKKYREVLRTQQPRIFVSEFKFGVKKFFVEISAYPSEHGLSVFVRDITERKRIEEELRESEERYRTLVENSPISVWEDDFSDVKKYIDTLRDKGVKDFRAYFEAHPGAVSHCLDLAKVLDVNRATLELYKAESKAELLSGLGKVFVKESFDVFKEELIAFAEGKTRFEGEAINQTLTGEKIDIILRVSVAPGHETTMSRVIALIIDITQRKQLEQELQTAYAELKEQYDRKMDFTNMAAHELRTPLVPIIGYLSMLKEAIQEEKLLRYIEIMERNAQRQGRLIDRMLELSRLDAGKVELEQSEVEVNELIQWMLYDYAPTGREFLVDVPGNLVIKGDEDKLFQIIDNLISNAVKYSPVDTPIKISIRELSRDYLFKVIDQGAGIAGEDQKRIFERFYIIGGNKTARESRRTGLGLALAKSYVELHNGKIWVESESGRGSTFCFTIPKEKRSLSF